jgi:PhnB protein
MKAPFPDVMASLAVTDVSSAAEFYVTAFGMRLRSAPMKDPQGVAFHAELVHGDGVIMLGLEGPGADGPRSPRTTLHAPPMTMYVYVEDVDAHYLQAKENGATVIAPPAQMFWGDRVHQVKCPEGYRWMFATHTGVFAAPSF